MHDRTLRCLTRTPKTFAHRTRRRLHLRRLRHLELGTHHREVNTIRSGSSPPAVTTQASPASGSTVIDCGERSAGGLPELAVRHPRRDRPAATRRGVRDLDHRCAGAVRHRIGPTMRSSGRTLRPVRIE
ncbi:hypothetical protein I545_5381 [Mycobacterium kansasii 662]|uniref:Uncharacterized protein n=1 Tax=Mycobacterium kansasii 662 TaxID=1299326 RepID=X7YXM2_MYCKA|nr:hypothetical protein I545_5381 [Mycobacterium kansasii 662]KEP43832.1 hypothetical protein MKSMC1_09080 [Mycobacterium kansasii]